MQCRIIVLPEGGTTPLSSWTVGEAPDGPASPPGGTRPWNAACVNRVSNALAGDLKPQEIFICLLRDELVNEQNRRGLCDLLREARQKCWGSKLFVVATDSIVVSPELVHARGALHQWLQEAVKGRVQDFLEISYDPFHPEGINGNDLRKAVDRVDARQRALCDLYPRDRCWRCVFPSGPENDLKATLLWPLVQPSRADADGDLLIVVPELDPEEQRRSVEVNLRRFPGRRWLVGTLGTLPSRELLEYCAENGLPETLFFAGEFELLYFLLLLNHGVDATVGPTTEARPVARLDGPPTFRPCRRPTFLFTSAFKPDERDHCLAAAADIGMLLGDAPLELRYRVEPAINRERMKEVLRRIDDAIIWIHMGHGEANEGLREASSEGSSPAERWLQCFQARQPPIALPLAIFLTCHSADVARVFAQAGAGVAIGFVGRVGTDYARELAVPIVKAILRDGADRATILSSFRAGVAGLEVAEWDPGGWTPSGPRAYYPQTR